MKKSTVKKLKPVRAPVDTCELPGQSTSTLEEQLEKIKQKVGRGFEVKIRWLPGRIKYKNTKQLLEEVSGNTIFIYSSDVSEAKDLLVHGFAEWLLNQNTKRYTLLINKLIEVFEEIQYSEKEKIADTIARLLLDSN